LTNNFPIVHGVFFACSVLLAIFALNMLKQNRAPFHQYERVVRIRPFDLEDTSNISKIECGQDISEALLDSSAASTIDIDRVRSE
jgi:hypothetical protein